MPEVIKSNAIVPPTPLEEIASLTKKPARRRNIDFLALCIFAATIYILAIILDLHEKVDNFIHTLPGPLEIIDQAIITLALVSLAFSILWWRRWRNTDAEIGERERMQTILERTMDGLQEQVEKQTHQLQENKELYRTLTEASQDAIFLMDFDGTMVYANAWAAQSMHLSPQDLIGKTQEELFPPNIAESNKSRLHQVVETGQPSNEDAMMPLPDGDHWFNNVMSPIKDETGEVTYILGIARDITDRKLAEQELLENRDTLEKAVEERTAELKEVNAKLNTRAKELEERNREVAIFSEMADILQASISAVEVYSVIAQFAEQLFPEDAGALYIINNYKNAYEAVIKWGDLPPAVDFFDPSECWAVRNGRSHIARDGHGIQCPHVGDRKSGSICQPFVAGGEVLGIMHYIFANAEENSDEKLERKSQFVISTAEHTGLSLANLKLRDRLQALSIHDQLTGLFNRRYMIASLEQELARSERIGDSISLIMMDIDHFKQFNDEFGHQAGDAALSEIGKVIKTHVRSGDIACRYGGEEFLLILIGTSLEEARASVEHIRAVIEKTRILFEGRQLEPIRISAGIAVYPDNGKEMEALIRAADRALYQAKKEGRDRVVLADGD